jgi:hypothetical protein
VLVREDDDVAKVVDFGIARRLTSPAAARLPADGPTLTGKLAGTPQYAAKLDCR